MRIAILTAAALLPAAAGAQGFPDPLTPFALNGAYTQNFDVLASTGTTGSTLPAGFQVIETGGSALTSYGVNNGGNNAGNSYSYGTTGSTDRALGSLASGTVTQIMFGGVFTNGLAGTITNLAFAYTGEQWRLANSTDDGLTFQYLVGATDVDGTGWTSVSALDFAPVFTNGTSTGAALNGDLPVNQRAIAATIGGLSLAAGQSFGFRWVDVNSSASDQGLAVDNLAIAASLAPVASVPETATWAMLIVGFGVMGGALRRRRPVRVAAAA